MAGTLQGIRVLELGGLGPAPFTGMVLADHGAEVIRVDRLKEVGGDGLPVAGGPLTRGKRSIALNLKDEAGVEIAKRLAAQSDVLLEGFRPGVAERLGLGPDQLLADNPGLLYTRITGWGQTGAYAALPGHDLNYVALSGALDAIGPRDLPVPPLNLVGDFGGGGMLAVCGVLAALVERSKSGKGQVIDVAMVDGISLLTTAIHAQRAEGKWVDQREANFVDGGAPFYGVYETSDGRHIAVGAGEPAFYNDLLRGLELDADATLPDQNDRDGWPALKERFASIFKQRSRDAWLDHFAGTQACITPVLSWTEAQRDAHLVERETYVESAGVLQPAPAPRFSRTPAGALAGPAEPGQHTAELLAELGFDAEQIAAMQGADIVGGCRTGEATTPNIR